MLKFNLIFLLLISINGMTQDSLRYDKEYRAVYQDKNLLNMSDMFTLMRPYEEPFELIESARDCRFYSRVFGFLGGLPLGYSLGYFLFTQEMQWPVFAAGVGLIGGSAFFHLRSHGRIKKAVDSYNRNIDLSATSSNSLEFSFGISQNGLGMSLTF